MTKTGGKKRQQLSLSLAPVICLFGVGAAAKLTDQSPLSATQITGMPGLSQHIHTAVAAALGIKCLCLTQIDKVPPYGTAGAFLCLLSE